MSETRNDEEYRALCEEAARLYGWDAMATSEFVSRYGIATLRENIARNRPATPTPAADGEADDALFKLRRAINGLRVSEAVPPTEVPWADEIEGRLDAYLALRARPLPDDVRAAAAHADLMAGHAEALARETENPAMRETYERNASSLRTLLAHLTREAR